MKEDRGRKSERGERQEGGREGGLDYQSLAFSGYSEEEEEEYRSDFVHLHADLCIEIKPIYNSSIPKGHWCVFLMRSCLTLRM